MLITSDFSFLFSAFFAFRIFTAKGIKNHSNIGNYLFTVGPASEPGAPATAK